MRQAGSHRIVWQRHTGGSISNSRATLGSSRIKLNRGKRKVLGLVLSVDTYLLGRILNLKPSHTCSSNSKRSRRYMVAVQMELGWG